MTYNSYDEIRSKLAQRLGREPKSEVWNRLVNEEYVREVWLDIEEIDYLEEKYRQLAVIPDVLLQPPKGATDSGLRRIRLQILSDLIACQAATEESVTAFRQQNLAGGLLDSEEVVDWITRQAEKDGPASRYLKVLVPDGYEPIRREGRILAEPLLSVSEFSPAIQVEVETLSYVSPDDKWVQRIPVKHGGTLDKLRVVSESLSRRFTWEQAQASIFVLTGIAPLLFSMRGGTRMTISQPVSSRITMEIDPTLKPGEVAEQYMKLRARLIGARYRPMTEKHLRLADFYRGHKPEGTTWTALMNKWNHSQVRKWQYHRYEVFARDCKQAWRRLMGRDMLKFPDL